ncbi:MAG: branched-chain amino acid transport system substrate-binding protein [Actinomycetota bacterium]|nr:branched-chain amino acid transport system substrate-binding protein [Actinomycetota bacterium]
MVAVILGLAGLSACSGGSGGGGSGGADLDGGLTGPPIVVGLINQEDAPVGSFPDLRLGAEAAVGHVNADLGGVGGRPIRLASCATRGTAESSQACANKLVGRHPVAVIGGVDLGSAVSLPVLEGAGVPYVGSLPQLGQELTSGGAYMLAGGTVADLLGQAQYALDVLHAKRFGALYLDLPGVLATVVRASELVLKARGATDVRLVPAKAEEADFTPALTAATAGKPDVVFVVFPAQACARIMQAAEALSVTAKLFFPSACVERSVVEAAGSGAEGAYFGSAYLPLADPSPEVEEWRSRTKSEGVLSQAGFSAVMNVHRILTEAGGATPAAVSATLAAARDHPGFMTHAYTCDGKQVPIMTAVCNPWVRILRYGDGRFDDVVGDWVDGSPLVKLFG